MCKVLAEAGGRELLMKTRIVCVCVFVVDDCWLLGVCVCVCVCECMHLCVCLCVCVWSRWVPTSVCVQVCVFMCVCV